MASFFAFLTDQLTKVIAMNHLDEEQELLINPMLTLLRVHNEKYIMGSYDVLSGDYALNGLLQYKVLYATISLLLIISIAWVSKQEAIEEESWGTEFAKTGLFLMVGGIMGNLFDVIFRENGVVDFIGIKGLASYPVLNYADFVIYLGFTFIALSSLIIVPNHFRQKM